MRYDIGEEDLPHESRSVDNAFFTTGGSRMAGPTEVKLGSGVSYEDLNVKWADVPYSSAGP